jgi:hypothetical protein
MVSRLSLDVIETTNTKVLRLVDSSQYNQGIDIDCARLLITPPGFTDAVLISVDPFFNLSINSNNLLLTQVSREQDMVDIPDGVYVIHYSIAPNDKVWVEYNHLRITQILKSYSQKLCSIFNNCDLTPKQRNEKLEELRKIKSMIEGAKSLVEWCKSSKKGLELYQYALKKLNKFSECKTC